jgi:hypothetical protein
MESTVEGFKLSFKGSFYETCGFYDYFDDLRYFLEDNYGRKTVIEFILEVPGGAEVEFKYA